MKIMSIETPKIHILFRFVEGPWGGANQFLKALRKQFRDTGVYSESPDDAEILLFNSYPFGSEYLFALVHRLKGANWDRILVHRVDGPISLVRGSGRKVDKIIYKFNEFYADGTVFISKLSRRDNMGLGMKTSDYQTVILSAPDPDIFNTEGKEPFGYGKTRLIATSWSSNERKGFGLYQFLDRHLDFNKYEMTFIGNSPVKFQNIYCHGPVPSRELARLLKESDIYITASEYEPFGQGVIEALSCGLPGVIKEGSGCLEAAGKAVEVFHDESDVLAVIDAVAGNYDYYQRKIALPSLARVAQDYYEFARMIYWNATNPNKNLGDEYRIKKANFWRLMRLKWLKIYARLPLLSRGWVSEVLNDDTPK